MASLLGTIVADFETQLATALAVGDTTATLQSATDDDSVALPAGRYFFTIDGDSASKEHISCTLSGTSLTSIKTVTRQGVETSGVARKHRVGATVTITNFAHIKQINDLLDGTTDFDSATPLKYDGDPTLSNDADIATKKYVDDVAIAGGADASTTTKGISKMSVAPASATNPIAVGDNDPRVPTTDENDALVGTSGSPSSSNKYVTADDVTEAKTASKIARRDSNSDILVATTPTSGDAAASKTYVDSKEYTLYDKTHVNNTQAFTGGGGAVTLWTSSSLAALQANDSIKIRAYVNIDTVSSGTHTTKLILNDGSDTTVAQIAQSSSYDGNIYFDITIANRNSTSSQFIWRHMGKSGSPLFQDGTATVDLSSAFTVKVTHESTSNSGNATLRMLDIELLKQ